MAVVWLFAGAVGVFVAAYLWLIVATGLVVSAPWMRNFDVVLLGVGLLLMTIVLGAERRPTELRWRIAAGVIVTVLATLISRAMLWVALIVDDSLLYALAAASDTSVGALGLTPLRYVALSAVGFAVAGTAMAIVFAWLPRRQVRG